MARSGWSAAIRSSNRIYEKSPSDPRCSPRIANHLRRCSTTESRLALAVERVFQQPARVIFCAGAAASDASAREGIGAGRNPAPRREGSAIMRKHAVLAAMFGLLVVGPAYAQNVTSARVLEQGVYSAQLSKEEKSGKTVSTGYKLVKSGTSIDSGDYQVGQFEDGFPRIGFWWYLDGSPIGKIVELKMIKINPDGTTNTSAWSRALGKKAWNGMRVSDW